MFERMLAKRYIGTQKRHSALTVCSIAIALALITMLFSVFSTVVGCLRNIAYDQGAYHIRVREDFNKEQYDAFAEIVSDYGTCTPEEVHISGELCYFVQVLFDDYIVDIETFMYDIGEQTGRSRINYTTNDLLMLCDVIDIQSRLYMTMIIALFYVFVLFLIMMLRLIIDTSFEISSKERERQLGVLQSIGATPGQIVRIITYEGLMLSVIGIPLGAALGIGLGYAAYRAVLSTGLAAAYYSAEKAAELFHFSVDPWLLLLDVVTGAVWVFLSAYGTGMRIIRMSPVRAISRRGNTVKRVRRVSLFGLLFGWTGRMASRNNMRQPKRFIATVVALTLSIAMFSSVSVVVSGFRSLIEEQYEQYPVPGEFAVYCDPEKFTDYHDRITFLEKSGLFSELHIEHSYWGQCAVPDPENRYNIEGSNDSSIIYLSRDAYRRFFDGAPPVSYDELTESGGYILGGRMGIYDGAPDTVSIKFLEGVKVITEDEYNALPPEDVSYEYTLTDDDVMTILEYYHYLRYTVDFDVYCTAALSNVGGGAVISLIGTIDRFDNVDHLLYKDRDEYIYRDIFCKLADDDDYSRAVEFLENSDRVEGFYDYSLTYRQMRAMLSSVNIGAAFISIMIALIAVVNMVNILSTGILNRRGELAAMQCAGMTEKQLYKMTAVECLQYALTSGIAAVAVCELMMFLTEKILWIVFGVDGSLEDFISYVQPLPIIGIASLCAFGIAMAASIIPLRGMRNTPLIDHIRSVD